MRRLLFSVLILAFAVPVFAQAKHPFTFEDMMKLKRVGDPQVSPDGKWVIFSVVDVDLDANTKTPHVWIVPTAGGQEKEIIADQDADRPRWAPDGKRFAFLSTKEGSSQVWIADFDGAAGTVTAVRKLTSIATEAGGELWSPDGKNILFTSDVYPECDGEPAQEQQCNAKKLKEVEQSKVKALIFDHLLYRHWNAYREGKRSHVFVIGTAIPTFTQNYNGPAIIAHPVDLTPGDYESPVFSLGGQDDYAFSPDGKEICYASNHDKNPAASTNNDLWIVPVSGGPAGSVQAKNITADNPASDSSPLYSPDGRYIAYRAQQRPGYESDRFRLMLYDRKTGEKKNLTENLDQWVGTFVWSPHSTRIFFGTADEGKPIVSSVLVATGERLQVPLLVMATTDDFAVSPDGYDFFFTNNSIQEPNAIWSTLLCPNGKDNPCGHLPPPPARRLTRFNDAVLSQVDMSSLESFWFTGAHGDKVEGFLVKPPNFDASKKYPVKFLIHGGPQGAWGDDWSYRWNPELFATPTSSTPSGYVVVMINFHGSTGYGQKFIDAINEIGR